MVGSGELSAQAFAGFIRTLGRGKRGARSLSQAEAREAMRQILGGRVAPEQLGAFLMLLRLKEETPEELAGLVQAARAGLSAEPGLPVVLDWPAYAGKRRHLPWFVLAALLLARNGIPVLMHGAAGDSERVHAEHALRALRIAPCTTLAGAHQALATTGFAYLPLAAFAPALQTLLDLRALLGLRSPMHTVVRLLNPFRAPHSLQGIFHPGYQTLHVEAAALLDDRELAVLRGEGGEAERNPERPCEVACLRDGTRASEAWPTLLYGHRPKPERLEPGRLAGLWEGEYDEAYATAAVIGTAAIALRLTRRAADAAEASQLARRLWDERPPLAQLRIPADAGDSDRVSRWTPLPAWR